MNYILVLIIIVLAINNFKLRKKLNLLKEGLKLAKSMYKNIEMQLSLYKEKSFKNEAIAAIKMSSLRSYTKKIYIENIRNSFDMNEARIKVRVAIDAIKGSCKVY